MRLFKTVLSLILVLSMIFFAGCNKDTDEEARNTTEADETTLAETTGLDTTEAETTGLDTTEAETTGLDTTEAETTGLDTTEADTTEADTTEGVTTEQKTTTDATTVPETTVPETTEPESTVPETATLFEFSDEASAALNSFRQSMIGTTQIFGAAYLGYIYDVSLDDYLKNSSLPLLTDLPFIGEIPHEQRIGEAGEVYCIVPLDIESTVVVKRAVKTNSGETVFKNELYSSNKGEPIIVLCNGGGFDPDTEIVITNRAGNGIKWYPGIEPTGRMSLNSGSCTESTVKDFSPYSQLLKEEYSQMQDSFWTLPTKEILVGSSWYVEELKDNGNVYWYELSFNGKTVDLRWNNDGEEHEYDEAPWVLKCVDGVALITLDLGGFAGETTFAVLITTEGNLLYTCANVVEEDETLPVDTVFSRTLERTYG